MNNNGFIVLHRKFTQWEWYNDLPTFKLFTHLIIMANWEDQKWQGIVIKRGQRLTSIKHLALETGLTVRQVRTALNKLKTTSELTSKSNNKYTVITLLNYNRYQDYDKQEGKRKTNERQTDDKRMTTNNNNNNNNKNNNNNIHTVGVEKNSKNSTTACTVEELRAISKDMKCDYKSVVSVHESIKDLIQAGEFKHKTVYYTLRNWLRMRIEKGTLQISKPSYEPDTSFDPLRD